MEFLQLSETTRAREIDAQLKKNKWINEWLDPARAWVAPGPLLDIFLFFSKTKIFHSHPCGYDDADSEPLEMTNTFMVMVMMM